MGRLEGVATLLDQRGQLFPTTTAGGHSWRGRGVGLRASQQEVLWSLNACPLECLTPSLLGTTFA